MKALLVLEDGTVFVGKSFGAQGEKTGEVVFNTSLSGYQEILTDPSYKGQIVCMTYPLIGNYGINSEDLESATPQLEGFIVRENSRIYSNFRATKSLGDYLNENNIVSISEIDTRKLVRKIRMSGAMKGIISTINDDVKSLIKKAKNCLGVDGVDLVKVVTCKKPYVWKNPNSTNKKKLPVKYKIAAYDYGIKWNILRNFDLVGAEVTLYPADYPAEDILKTNPDGIFLSNGPADPSAVTYAIENVKKLIGKKPIFGICLGNQILGLALGGKTYKLKFGHHGGNQPVKDLKTGKIDITAQNHGFAVDIDSIPGKQVELTHINLNDQTVEGMRHKKFPIFSVQHHPEAGPGPHDANYMFKDFIKMIENEK